MVNIKARSVKMLMAAALCATGLLIFSAATSAWLSDPSLSMQLWPADINRQIVSWLGGSDSRDALGDVVTTVPIASVFVRLAIIVLVFCSLTVLTHRKSAQDAATAQEITARTLKNSALIFVISSSWWGIWLTGATIAPPLASLCVNGLALWLMCSVAMLTNTWWSSIFASGSDQLVNVHTDASQRIPATVFVFTIGWIATSFWMNKCLYDQLLIPHGDSAMYEEHLWNIWHGKGFRSYLDQGLFLGEHIQVIHLLLLPLHLMWPSHLLLELTESTALGSCTIPIYLIARRHSGSARTATLLCIAWLFYFPMHFLDIAIDQKTFRPIALGIPFIFWLIEFAERRSLAKAGVCLLIALSAKEDMALVLAPLMAVLAIRSAGQDAQEAAAINGSKKPTQTASWLWAGSIFCVAYLVLVVLVIIPAFRSGDHVHYSRYFGDLGGTPGELVKTALGSPLRVIAKVLSLRTMLYGFVFLAPLAFLPARRPLALVAGMLTFGMLSLLELGDGPLPPVPYHHFHAPLLPILFWSASIALGDLPQLRRVFFARLISFCCIATSITGSMMPMSATFWSIESPFGYAQLYNPRDPGQQHRVRMIEVVLQQIPLTARVASTDYIHTRLTHCERSYDYSEYLRAVNDYQPGVPADTDFIVIDTGHRYSQIKSPADVRELKEAPDKWELLPDQTAGAFLILKRRR